MQKISRYIAILGVSLLTGCATSKVERLHTTTTKLSEDVEKYAALSNKSIDFNRELNYYLTKQMYSEQLSPEPSFDLQKNKELAADRFNTGFSTLYDNREREEAFKLQNAALVTYFKSLPLILENKNADINGVVKSIDQLNQVIEKNSKVSDELKEGLKKQESNLIGKSLSSGFSHYQYHIFKKAIKNHYPVILKSILYQKAYFDENNGTATDQMNRKYFDDLEALRANYVSQSINLANLPIKDEARWNPIYPQEQLDKVAALAQQPYKLVVVGPNEPPVTENQRVKSQAYLEYCQLDQKKQSQIFDKRKLKYAEQTLNFKNLQGQVVNRGYFDIEGAFKDSGDQVACEFINIMGLLSEHDFDRIELKTWEKSISDYDKLIDHVRPHYNQKKEVKKNDESN